MKDLDDYLTNDTNTYYILIVTDGETVIEGFNYDFIPYSIDSLKYIKLINKSVELGNNILDIHNSAEIGVIDHLKVKGILLSPGETVQIPAWISYEGEEVKCCFMLECGGIPYFSGTV